MIKNITGHIKYTKVYMALIVVNRIQNSLAFGNERVTGKTQLKTVVIKLFLWSFEDFTVVNCLIKQPPCTITTIILGAEQLTINSGLYPFDLLEKQTCSFRNFFINALFYSFGV